MNGKRPCTLGVSMAVARLDGRRTFFYRVFLVFYFLVASTTKQCPFQRLTESLLRRNPRLEIDLIIINYFRLRRLFPSLASTSLALHPINYS